MKNNQTLGKGRIIFIFVVAILSLTLIAFSLNTKGYEKVGRVYEYILYYDDDNQGDDILEHYILKDGFYEVSVKDAIDNNELSDDYINEIMTLIEEWELLYAESD